MLTDRELRDLLRSVEADAAPDPSFEAQLLGHLQLARSARGTVRRWAWLPDFRLGPQPALVWAALLLLLASLVLAGLAGVWRQQPIVDSTRPPTSSEPALAPAQLEVGYTEPAPGAPELIAVDPGSGLWVGTGGRVVRIDLVRHLASAPLEVSRAITAMKFQGSSLYVASHDDGTVSRVDYVSRVAVVTAALEAPVGLAVDTSLFFAGQQDKALGVSAPPARFAALVAISGTTDTVTELNGDTLAERWRQPVPGTPILLAEGGGRIWVAARPSDDPTALVLAAYEAGTGRVVGSFRLHGAWPTPRAIVAAQSGLVGSVWVPNPADGTVTVIDPDATGIVRTIDVGSGVTEALPRPGGSLVFTYAANPAANAAPNAMAVVDPRTGSVARYVVRTDPSGSGRGLSGLVSDDFADGSCCNSAVWHIWFGMDWAGDPSVGRVDTLELP